MFKVIIILFKISKNIMASDDYNNSIRIGIFYGINGEPNLKNVIKISIEDYAYS